MAKKKPWFPRSLAGQLAMFTNMLAKIGSYQAALGLTAAQVTEIETICTNFISIFGFHETSDATMKSLTAWRDLFFSGSPVGDPLPAGPIFANIGAVTAAVGSVTRFKEIRAWLVKLDGYTEAIGEDLMIEGAEETPVPEASLAPDLKLTVAVGYKVNVKASLKGMDALRIEYKPAGGSWSAAAFLTQLPTDVQLTPQTPGQPETGHIRAIFIHNNVEVGSYSPEYAVTLS